MFSNTSSPSFRRDRLDALRAQGIEPYNHTFEKSCNLLDIRQDFSHVSHGGVDVTFDLCGRIIGFRHESGMVYVELEEQQAQMLFLLQPGVIDAASLDIFTQFVLSGDYVGFKINKIFRTGTRELAARITQWTMIAPCLYDPPFDESVDVHQHRHLQLVVDRTVRRRFLQRSKIIRYLRSFLETRFDFFETILPAPHPDTPPDVRRANLTRLLVGGIEAIYDIVNITGEESLTHCGYPESQLLDCYKTFSSVSDMMHLIEQMICELSVEFFGGYHISNTHYESTSWHDISHHLSDDEHKTVVHTLNLSPRWRIESFYPLVQRVTGIDFDAITSPADALEAAHSRNIDLSGAATHSVAAIALAVAKQVVFPTLIQPTFVTAFPAETHAAYKRHGTQPDTTNCFELYVKGLCLATGGTPHNEPDEVERALDISAAAASPEVHLARERLIHAMQCGLPPVGCFHLSIDRLVMLLTNARDIRSIVYFPVADA